MKQESKRLLLAAALGLPVMLAGCRSRAELLSSKAVETPTRTVSSEQDDTVAPAADDAEKPSDSDQSTDTPEADSGNSTEVSLTKPSVDTPQSILESAGAVLEFDRQKRVVGVDLTEARLSARVTRSIAELSDLQWADLRGTKITDADLAVIGAVPQFELLALGDTKITDAGLRHLKQQKNLRFLSLDGTAVSDAGLAVIAGLPRLEAISLAKTSVSQAAGRDFEKQTPGCRVILDENAPATSPHTRAQQAAPKNPTLESPTPEKRPQGRAPATKEPVPGEPTTATDNTWFLDEEDKTAKPADFPQPTQSVPVGAATHSAQDTGKTLNQILQRRLLDPEVLSALSQHLLAQQQYAKAARALEALAALQPENQQVRFDLGVALARSGEFDRAYSQLVSIVGEATAYYNLGVIAYEMDQPLESERFFSRAVEISPDFAEARTWLSQVRKTNAVSTASHSPKPVDREDLVDLLMSEFGSVDNAAVPTGNRSAAGITIVPAKR